MAKINKYWGLVAVGAAAAVAARSSGSSHSQKETGRGF